MSTQQVQQAQDPVDIVETELPPYELLTSARTALDQSLDAANVASVAEVSASKRIKQIQQDLDGANIASVAAEQSREDSHVLIHGALDATEAAIRKLRAAYPLG